MFDPFQNTFSPFIPVFVVVVVDLPLLRVAVEGSDNPISLENRPRTSALRILSIHPAIRKPIIGRHTLGSCP